VPIRYAAVSLFILIDFCCNPRYNFIRKKILSGTKHFFLERDMMNVAKPLDCITLTEFETMEKVKTVTVHGFANNTAETYGISDTINSMAQPDLHIPVAKIFEKI
jgi:hypothetical protein